MVARIDWLNDGIECMLAGRSPRTPEEWDVRDSIRARDVDLLRAAAKLMALRATQCTPTTPFVSRLRERMTEEALATGGGE
jgi:hypothetical protein